MCLKVTALNGIIVGFKVAVHGNALLTHIGKQAVGNQNMIAVVQVNGICVAGGEVQTLNGDVRGTFQLEEGSASTPNSTFLLAIPVSE